MATYLILDAVMAVVALLVVMTIRYRPRLRLTLKVFGALLVMTTIGDNIIIRAGIVAYDPARISGLLISAAPLEDFAYTLVAVVLVPALWQLMKGRDR